MSVLPVWKKGISSLEAILSTLRLRTISNYYKKQEMNFQKKLFLQENWLRSSLVQPSLTLGCRPSLRPSLSLLQNHMATRKQMAKLWILMTRISQDLSLKSKPTWTLVTVTVSPLFVSYQVNLSVEWVSICLVLVRLPNYRMWLSLWLKVVKMWPMPWQVILSGFTIPVLIRLEIPWRLEKTSLNLNHCQPLPLKFSWKFLLRTSWNKNPSIRELSNWCKREPFSFIRITKQASTC